MTPRIAAFGEAALLVTFADRIDLGTNARARALADAWEARGLGPAVPAYASTVLRFDPLARSRDEVVRLAAELAAAASASLAPSGRVVEVPVRYDGEDLADVARLSGISTDEVVSLHAGREYHAYFLGFTPGFAYLGEVDPRIVAPRLAEPRSRVPAGSVAVITGQTAVYPRASPGGWRLIGRTELALFDPRRDPPSPLRAGDRVRFHPA